MPRRNRRFRRAYMERGTSCSLDMASLKKPRCPPNNRRRPQVPQGGHGGECGVVERVAAGRWNFQLRRPGGTRPIPASGYTRHGAPRPAIANRARSLPLFITDWRRRSRSTRATTAISAGVLRHACSSTDDQLMSARRPEQSDIRVQARKGTTSGLKWRRNLPCRRLALAAAQALRPLSQLRLRPSAGSQPPPPRSHHGCPLPCAPIWSRSPPPMSGTFYGRQPDWIRRLLNSAAGFNALDSSVMHPSKR